MGSTRLLSNYAYCFSVPKLHRNPLSLSTILSALLPRTRMFSTLFFYRCKCILVCYLWISSLSLAMTDKKVIKWGNVTWHGFGVNTLQSYSFTISFLWVNNLKYCKQWKWMTGNRIPQSPVDWKIPQVMRYFLFNSLHLFSDSCLCWPNGSLLKSNEIYTTSVQVIQLPHRLIYWYCCIYIHKTKIEMCTLN